MTTPAGQIQIFQPFGGGVYQCDALYLEYYTGDPNGEYDPGGSGFVCPSSTKPDDYVYYQPVSPGYYVGSGGGSSSVPAGGAFFMPLP